MILSQLTVYLAEHKEVALVDPSNRWKPPLKPCGACSPWEGKGRVSNLHARAACGGARLRRERRTIEVYQGIGD